MENELSTMGSETVSSEKMSESTQSAKETIQTDKIIPACDTIRIQNQNLILYWAPPHSLYVL